MDTREDSVSAKARRRVEGILPVLFAASERLLTHRQFRDYYPNYLFTLHTMIRASVPLMQAAEEHARRLSEGADPVSRLLVPYLAKHIQEEAHHDDWLLEDLEAIGYVPESLRSRPPSMNVAYLVGSQYYWTYHYHPVCLLGYISILEGYPVTPEQIEEMRQATGYPPQAFRTLMKHADLDPHHRDDLDALLDRLPLTEQQEELMSMNAIVTVKLCAKALLEVVQQEPLTSDALAPV